MEKKRFAGIEVAPDLRRRNFLFLYLNTILIGILLTVPGIIQPAFLKDIIKVTGEFFGSINGALQSIAQVASLLFIGILGMFSDKTGRKPLAVSGFIVLAVLYFLFLCSNEIASFLHIPAGFAATLCAALSFSSNKDAFLSFSPGLLTAYLIRFLIGFALVLVFPQFKTMVADYTREKDRGKGMALNGLMIGVGSLIVFTALAPLGKKSGVEMLFYVSVFIAVAGTILTLWGVRERLPEKKVEKRGLKELLGAVNKSLALKASYLCGLVTRVDVAITGTFLITWAVTLAPRYGLSSEEASFKGAVPMIVMSIFTMIAFPVFGILLDRWGRVPTIILSLFLGGAGFLLVAASPTPFLSTSTFIGVLLVGCSVCGAVVGSSALTADASPPGMVGSALGGLNTMAQIGMILFLASGGVLFDRFGPWAVFLVKGTANLAVGLLIFIIRKKIRIHPEKG
ncbi:MAG: MFS transporter [Deltaproteobacteria bacterium]|nr:MFS transporter [Deltaproteobacteria bacterium]